MSPCDEDPFPESWKSMAKEVLAEHAAGAAAAGVLCPRLREIGVLVHGPYAGSSFPIRALAEQAGISFEKFQPAEGDRVIAFRSRQSGQVRIASRQAFKVPAVTEDADGPELYEYDPDRTLVHGVLFVADGRPILCHVFTRIAPLIPGVGV